jgi:hypothetical protein
MKHLIVYSYMLCVKDEMQTFAHASLPLSPLYPTHHSAQQSSSPATGHTIAPHP